MLSLTRIRNNPDLIKAGLEAKNESINLDEILKLDEKNRDNIHQLNELRAERNRASEEIAGAKRAGKNSDDAIAACGFKNREEIEQEGPTRLAESLIVSIKEFAIKKRERLGNNPYEVDVTVALIGDSRTGKSETAEKMEGILNMNIA